MKKMLSVLILGVAGVAFVHANTIENANRGENANPAATQRIEISMQEETAADSVKRTMIEITELPEALQTTLRDEDYAEWEVVTVYYVEEEGKDPYYEVSLQKEGEEDLRIVLLNADGTVRE